MGPFAGIGDSIYTGALRIVATSIALGFCQQGGCCKIDIYVIINNSFILFIIKISLIY